jgi:capsular exopolysaccharide synthesis family protein
MTDQSERDVHLLDYWRIVVRRRWIVYASLLVVTVTVALGSLLMRPVYRATTRLQIEPSTPNVLPFQEVLATVPDQRNDFYQTQYGLIQSRRVARDVIASLRLEQHPDFRVKPGRAGKDAPQAAEIVETRRIDLFLENLKVSPVRNSRLVDIAFSSHDRALAAAIANRVAETYIAFNTRAEYNTTERASTSLTHQVANLQEAIDAKEKELQEYARAHGIVVLSEKQNISLKNLNDMSDSYTRARAGRIEKEARVAALRQAAPADLPEVRENKLIQDLTAKAAELRRREAQLSGKYKGDWPELVRLRREIDETTTRLESERRSIHAQVLGAAESAWLEARNEESYLGRALEEQKRQTQELGLKEIQYNNLKAEIANKRSTLEALVKRQSETSSSAGMNDLVAGNIRIVDVAEVPSRPASPRVLLNLLLSVVAGLSLGVGLAFFFEYLDKSVKTGEDVLEITGAGTLGMIPLLAAGGGRLRAVARSAPGAAAGAATPPVELASHEDPQSKIAEAFREMRTALLVSQAGGPPRTLLIASTQPGEGKTMVSLNLAIVLAQLGRRVLLVDADLRKPRLHRILRIDNTRGLSNCLGTAGTPWPEPVPTDIPGVDLIPSGPLPPNPADLLDSSRFTVIQEECLARGYDHIVYDSPPVLAVADPTILAGRVDAVLLVVHAGVTGKDSLRHACQRLAQVKGRLLGSVLNQVDFALQDHYGYSYKRYYGEEKPAGPPARPRPERRAASRRRTEPRVEA